MKCKSKTPIFDSAYQECLDDTGLITRLEPLYNAFERLENELNDIKDAIKEAQLPNEQEIHCSCCALLRVKIKQLENKIESYKSHYEAK